MSLTAYITRAAGDCRELTALLQKEGIYLQAVPQTRQQAVAFDPQIPVTDWIFFSSRQAVRFFFMQQPVLGRQKFGAIGQATARVVNEFVVCDFAGQDPDTAVVAREFKQILNQDTALFPQSAQGLRTAQKQLPPGQVTDLVCYETIADPQAVGYPDILVFTSPQNVKSFFRANRMLDHQRAVAFGSSTQQALREEGWEHVLIPSSLETADLVRAIIAAGRS